MTSANRWNSTYDLRNTSHMRQKRKLRKDGSHENTVARRAIAKDNLYVKDAWWVYHDKHSAPYSWAVLIKKHNIWYTQFITMDDNRKQTSCKTYRHKTKEAALEYYRNCWQS